MRKMAMRIMGAVTGVGMVIPAAYYLIRGSEMLIKTILYCAVRKAVTHYEVLKFFLVFACFILSGLLIYIGYGLVRLCIEYIYEIFDERCEKCSYGDMKIEKKE